MRQTAKFFWMAALVLAIAAAAQAQEVYPIRLVRPFKVGQKYAVELSGQRIQKQTTTPEGGAPRSGEESLAVELKGTLEVLSITEQGRLAKANYLLESCTRTIGDKIEAMFEKGQTLTREIAQGHNKLTIDQQPVEGSLAESLELIFSIGGDDDACFGTDQPRKVGDTWPVNTKAYAATTAQAGMPVKAESIEGTCRLVGLKKQGETNCLEAAAEVRIKDMPPPQAEEGVTFTKGTSEANFSGLFPVDVALQPALMESKITTKISAKLKDAEGKDVAAELVVEAKLSEKLTAQ